MTFIHKFHGGMMVKILDDGGESDPFPEMNGVSKAAFLLRQFLA